MSAPAGWHPDPESQGVLRYWDGRTWTNHRAPAQAVVAPKDQSSLVTLGFALAILFPIGGFVVGIMLERKEGWWILALSLAFGFGWFVLAARLSSGY